MASFSIKLNRIYVQMFDQIRNSRSRSEIIQNWIKANYKDLQSGNFQFPDLEDPFRSVGGVKPIFVQLDEQHEQMFQVLRDSLKQKLKSVTKVAIIRSWILRTHMDLFRSQYLTVSNYVVYFHDTNNIQAAKKELQKYRMKHYPIDEQLIYFISEQHGGYVIRI